MNYLLEPNGEGRTALTRCLSDGHYQNIFDDVWLRHLCKLDGLDHRSLLRARLEPDGDRRPSDDRSHL